jgi:hypothetical protein
MRAALVSRHETCRCLRFVLSFEKFKVQGSTLALIGVVDAPQGMALPTAPFYILYRSLLRYS